MCLTEAFQTSDVGLIRTARSRNPDDSIALTQLSYRNPLKERLVLDASWTLAVSIGRQILSMEEYGMTALEQDEASPGRFRSHFTYDKNQQHIGRELVRCYSTLTLIVRAVGTKSISFLYSSSFVKTIRVPFCMS
jgi:hypothetical protein